MSFTHFCVQQLGAISPGVLPAHTQEDCLAGLEGLRPEEQSSSKIHLPP